MHRAATLAEVQALLKASSASSYDAKRLKAVDKTRRSDSELETVVSIQAGMSKYLERRIQHALDYFVEQLQNDDLRTDVAATANFDWRHLEQEDLHLDDPSSTFSQDCREFVTGLLCVYERDFIRLLNDRHSALFDGHNPAVTFLLTGITLGLLYGAVPTKHTLLEQLSHGTLIRMAATEIWIHALKLYGPAPALPVLHRTNRAPTVDAFFDPRRREEARTALAARQAHRSNIVKRRHRTSSVTQRAITCPQCEHGLDPSDDAIHCDSCRSFIIRYTMHERGYAYVLTGVSPILLSFLSLISTPVCSLCQSYLRLVI
eukprot:m.72707 g.72707  ORF g.72707 m.72707 type:complete len:317 (-) comp14276_c0_seq6:2-952(-)